MTKISADNVLFTFGMFAILMVAFGQTIPSADVQNNMNILFANWPTLQSVTPPDKTCGTFDAGCQASKDVAHATAFIAVPFLWLGATILSAFTRVSAFGGLIGFVTFGSATGINAIPFGALFLLALFIVVAWELFRSFRGSPSGL